MEGKKEIMDKPAIDVAYVAELARLDLTDDERSKILWDNHLTLFPGDVES